jgi:hypothetical protein
MEVRKMKERKFKVAILVLTLLVSPLGFSAPNNYDIPDSRADLDGDLFVTSKDISKLASCIGQNPHNIRDCKPADMDEDGDIDIDDYRFVSARLGQSYPELVFSSPIIHTGGARNVTVGDVNSNGLDEIVVVDRGTISIVSFVDDGNPEEKLIDISGSPPNSVVMGDVNGDNKVDLIINASSGASPKIVVYLANGDYSFQDPRETTIDEYNYISSLTVGDINNDGKLDLLALEENTILVFLGNGNGSFQPQQSFPTDDPVSMALGDMNADECLDVVVINRKHHISVLLGNGDGTLQVPQRFPTGETPVSMSLDDLNGDGKLDIFSSNKKGVHCFLQL